MLSSERFFIIVDKTVRTVQKIDLLVATGFDIDFLKKCDTIVTVITGAVPKSKQPPVVVA